MEEEFIAVGTLNNQFDFFVIENPTLKETEWRGIKPGTNTYGFGVEKKGSAADNRIFWTTKDRPLIYRGIWFDTEHNKNLIAFEFYNDSDVPAGKHYRFFIMVNDLGFEFLIMDSKHMRPFITRPHILLEPHETE